MSVFTRLARSTAHRINTRALSHPTVLPYGLGPARPPFRVNSTLSGRWGRTSKTGKVLGIVAIGGVAILAPAAWFMLNVDGPIPEFKERRTVTVGKGKDAEVHEFELLSFEAVDTKLKSKERLDEVGREGNPVVRSESSSLARSDEDASALIVVHNMERRVSAAGGNWKTVGQKDIEMFSVVDGQQKPHMAHFLETAAHMAIYHSLEDLRRRIKTGLPPSQSAYLPDEEELKVKLREVQDRAWTPEHISKTLALAYGEMDALPAASIVALSNLPFASHRHKDEWVKQTVGYTALANFGASALSAVIDSENDDLYVLSTGICRAVAGWEKEGVWRCDVLSEDHTVQNPNEIERLKKAFPEEAGAFELGRKLDDGKLALTRMFGKSGYKWEDEDLKHVETAFKDNKSIKIDRPPKRGKVPHLTAAPSMTHRKITNENGEKLRFLILGTGNLWSRLTSEEATLLVASNMAHATHDDIAKTDLAARFPLAPHFGERPFPAQSLPGTEERAEGVWTFAGDANASTHLLRNAFGGADPMKIREMMSATGEAAKYLPHDTSAT